MRVDVRLEEDVWRRAVKFMRENDLDGPSACVKVLVELGLSRADQLEAGLRSAALREGLRQGKKKFNEIAERLSSRARSTGDFD